MQEFDTENGGKDEDFREWFWESTKQSTWLDNNWVIKAAGLKTKQNMDTTVYSGEVKAVNPHLFIENSFEIE